MPIPAITHAGQQIILAVAGSDNDILCKLIACTPFRVNSAKLWIINSIQQPVDVAGPPGVQFLSGLPPAVVAVGTGANSQLTVVRRGWDGKTESDWNSMYSMNLEFNGGIPSLTDPTDLATHTNITCSLLCLNGAVTIISQDPNDASSSIISQVTKPGSTKAQDSPQDPPQDSGAATTPPTGWTNLPFKSNQGSPSPVSKPYSRLSFVPCQSTSSSVTVIETRMNFDQLKTQTLNGARPEYSFGAYTMSISDFNNIQTDKNLFWSQFRINATSPNAEITDHPILSSPAPIVVPVTSGNSSTTSSGLLYVFYSQPSLQQPFCYLSTQLSQNFNVTPDSSHNIAAVPSPTIPPWPFYNREGNGPWSRSISRSVEGQSTVLSASEASDHYQEMESAPTVMVSVSDTTNGISASAIFVFFLVETRTGNSVAPCICYASQEIPPDGKLLAGKWFWGDLSIPTDLEWPGGQRPCMFSAITVPVTNGWFPYESQGGGMVELDPPANP